MHRLFEAQLAASPNNPALIVRVAHQSYQKGDYIRTNILLGRAITLGVKTFKVYSVRGQALLKLAEAGGRQNPVLAMEQFIDSAIMFDKAISLGALSGQATLPLLLDAARCYFRAGSYEQAIRLLCYLVEKLPFSPLKEDITEVALQASQSLYVLGHYDEAVKYMRFVFNQVTDRHHVRKKPTPSTQDNDGRDTDSEFDSDSDDENDVFGSHHGVMSERAMALILNVLVKAQHKQQQQKDSNSREETHQKHGMLLNSTLLDDAAVQYSFFRHRAAAFATNKKGVKKQSTLKSIEAFKTFQNNSSNTSSSTSTSTTATTTTTANNNDLETSNANKWSQDPSPWVRAGDECVRNGQPVYASLCYQQATDLAQQFEQAHAPWYKSVEHRPKPPMLATCISKYAHALMLIGGDAGGSISNNFNSGNSGGSGNKASPSSTAHRQTDIAIHCIHVSYQHYRWLPMTRVLLLLHEPKQWHHLFLIQNAAAVAVQRRVRGILVRSRSNVDRAATKIQSTYRMFQQKKIFVQKRQASTRVQSSWRGVAERMGNVWRRRVRVQAVVKLSSLWRGSRGRLLARYANGDLLELDLLELDLVEFLEFLVVVDLRMFFFSVATNTFPTLFQHNSLPNQNNTDWKNTNCLKKRTGTFKPSQEVT